MFIKRLNYFTHQFLREQDFKDEQAYHLEMCRRHNRMLHGWGVVTGLEVQKKGEREITINPGTAIDKEGRELMLAELFPATSAPSSATLRRTSPWLTRKPWRKRITNRRAASKAIRA